MPPSHARAHYAWTVLGVTVRGRGGPIGDYHLAFWTSGGLCLLAAALALRIGVRRPHFTRMRYHVAP